MEDALAHLSVTPVTEEEFEVLILVLMEDALARGDCRGVLQT